MKNMLLAVTACVVTGFGAAMAAQSCDYSERILQCTFAVCIAAAAGIPVLFMRTWKPSMLIVCLLIILGIYGPFVVSGRKARELMQVRIVHVMR